MTRLGSRVLDVLQDAALTARTSPARSVTALLGATLSVGLFVWAVTVSATGARSVDESFAALDARRLLIELPVDGSAWGGVPPEVVDAAGRLPGAIASALVVERPVRLTTLRAPHLALDVDTTIYTWDGSAVALGTDASAAGDLGGILAGAGLANRETLRAGSRVELDGAPYRVTGLMTQWDAAPDVLLGVVEHRRQLAADRDDVGLLAVYVRPGQADEVARRLRILMSPERPSSVFVRYPPSPDALRADVGAQVDGLVLAAAAGLLLVSAAGVGVATFARVLEQRRMLGLRRAIGASRVEVASSIVLETGTIAACGAVLGVATGLSAAVVQLAGQQVVIPWAQITLGVVAAVGVNAASAVMPAAAAVRTPPAEAVRPR